MAVLFTHHFDIFLTRETVTASALISTNWLLQEFVSFSWIFLQCKCLGIWISVYIESTLKVQNIELVVCVNIEDCFREVSKL